MSSRRSQLTWEDVARIGLELPGVEVGTAYGTPADEQLVRELVEDLWAERAPKRLVAAHRAVEEGSP